jgi:hypothetical protein
VVYHVTYVVVLPVPDTWLVVRVRWWVKVSEGLVGLDAFGQSFLGVFRMSVPPTSVPRLATVLLVVEVVVAVGVPLNVYVDLFRALKPRLVEFDAEYGERVVFEVSVPTADAEAVIDRLRSATGDRVEL